MTNEDKRKKRACTTQQHLKTNFEEICLETNDINEGQAYLLTVGTHSIALAFSLEELPRRRELMSVVERRALDQAHGYGGSIGLWSQYLASCED
jgi:hypothetical protein